MQLCAGMRRPGQATAAKTRRGHSEVAAVFLDEDVRRGLRCTKEGMFRVIDAHCFRNAGLVLCPARFPTATEVHATAID